MRLWYKKAAWSSRRAGKVLAKIDPESVQSIAVIRHAALGDMIHTRPFLLDLKQAFPNAKITFSIISRYSRGTPEDLVDRVHVVHRSASRKQGIFSQIKVIRELGYHDLIFDLCDTPRSRMIAALNPAKVKLGYTSHMLIKYMMLDVNVPRSDLVFEADMNLQLLSILGIKTSYPPRYGLGNLDKQERGKYVIYFPSASDPKRFWHQDRVVELVSKMAGSFADYSHYILKGIGDEEKIDPIIECLKDVKTVESVEKDSLDDTIEFIGKADLVVSNDTSIRHLAIATGTPSVGIYFGSGLGSTPFRYWPRWGHHEAAFEIDGSQPSVENVFSCCKRLLEPEKFKEAN